MCHYVVAVLRLVCCLARGASRRNPVGTSPDTSCTSRHLSQIWNVTVVDLPLECGHQTKLVSLFLSHPSYPLRFVSRLCDWHVVIVSGDVPRLARARSSCWGFLIAAGSPLLSRRSSSWGHHFRSQLQGWLGASHAKSCFWSTC